GNQNQEFYDSMSSKVPGYNDKLNAESAITHEIGHHVYQTGLTDSERRTWDYRIYDRDSFRDNISNYAGSQQESFAEAMRMYKYHPDVLKEKLPHVYNFMERTDRGKHPR